MKSDDGALLARMAGGDEASFDELWARHAPWLLLRLRRRSPSEATDLLQETFLAAWRNAGSFSGSDASSWLWTIASRRLIDAHRRAATIPAPVEDPQAASSASRSVSASTAHASSEDLALAGTYDPRLEIALAQLSPDLLAALQATVIDGLSTREAALLLGVAEGTVKSRTSRARAALRTHLAHPNRLLEGL